MKQEIKPITGWTAGFTVDYTITGIYQFGFAGTYNGATVPAGTYTISAPTRFNSHQATRAINSSSRTPFGVR